MNSLIKKSSKTNDDCIDSIIYTQKYMHYFIEFSKEFISSFVKPSKNTKIFKSSFL